MTFGVVFLPIIIIGIFIAVIVFRSNVISFRWINGKRAYMLLIIYMVFLLISAGVYVFGPEPDAAERDYEAREHLLRDISGDIFDIIESEQSIDVLDHYIKDHETIPYEASELTVQVSNNNYLSSNIIIDQTSDLERNIEVTYYETPTYANGINVNDYLKHLSYHFNEDTLMLEEPYRETEVTIIHLDSEEVFDQFMVGSESSQNSMMQGQHDIEINPDVLYIQVPKDLKINSESYQDQIHIIK